MPNRKPQENSPRKAARKTRPRSTSKSEPHKKLDADSISTFREAICQYYAEHARNLPWRRTKNPYRILVSEIMLQQTQVERVIPKYERFIAAFPRFSSLDKAPLRDVLRVWHGLGYNRRAIALMKIAELVTHTYGGRLPSDVETLLKFPGIGKATASAIAAFAFNRPAGFIETNIRRVFIHFFFRDRDNVKDSHILPLVEATLDAGNPREWYYALMDYGAMLGKNRPNPNLRSAYYQKQSLFEGSDRQIRGRILRALVESGARPVPRLAAKIEADPERTRKILLQLEKEGFIKKKRGTYLLA